MGACKDFEGLIATSLYEALGQEERGHLDVHTQTCAACREELRALGQLITAIPRTEVVFEGDLLPSIREQLRERPSRLWWRWALGAGLAATLALGVLTHNLAAPGRAPVLTASESPASVLAQRVEEANTQAASGELTLARQTLAEALAASPDDPAAGEAQLSLAGLEYGELKWYEEAHGSYLALAQRYPEVYRQHPEAFDRLNLLEEAHKKDFQPLRDLDLACASEADPFESLERVVAENPGTYLASLAVSEMMHAMGTAGSGSDAQRVASLEAVRGRCSDTVAIAQVAKFLGDAYWRELKDVGRARAMYEEVARSEVLALAALGHEALAALDSPASE